MEVLALLAEAAEGFLLMFSAAMRIHKFMPMVGLAKRLCHGIKVFSDFVNFSVLIRIPCAILNVMLPLLHRWKVCMDSTLL